MFQLFVMLDSFYKQQYNSLIRSDLIHEKNCKYKKFISKSSYPKGQLKLANISSASRQVMHIIILVKEELSCRVCYKLNMHHLSVSWQLFVVVVVVVYSCIYHNQGNLVLTPPMQRPSDGANGVRYDLTTRCLAWVSNPGPLL